MSVLFNHARRYDLYDRNPIQWVRQSLNAVALLTSSPATRSGNCWQRWGRGSESWSYWMWQQD